MAAISAAGAWEVGQFACFQTANAACVWYDDVLQTQANSITYTTTPKPYALIKFECGKKDTTSNAVATKCNNY